MKTIRDKLDSSPDTPPAVTESAARSAATDASVFGPSLDFRGELEVAENLLVEGRLEGTVKHTAEQLIIGSSGNVYADIDARNLVIHGVVEGNIVGSESVVIHEGATVRGNIYTPSVSIAVGAQFNGNIDMDAARSQKH